MELVVVMAIMGILAAAMMAILNSTSSMYTKGKNMVNAREIASVIGADISNDVKKAKNVYLLSSWVESSAVVTNFSQQAGYISIVDSSDVKVNRMVKKKSPGNQTNGSWFKALYGNDEASRKAFYGNFGVELTYTFLAENNKNTTLIINITVYESITSSTVVYSTQVVPTLLCLDEEGIVRIDDPTVAQDERPTTYSYLYFSY